MSCTCLTLIFPVETVVCALLEDKPLFAFESILVLIGGQIL